ncbi:MAG: hypothetical protein JKY87_01025 [Mariprofundus sp.]|nr:hypothetical protein [Mariprofundus sp.]
MLKIEIHEFASLEFDEAIEWYEFQTAGLGNRFKKLVVSQIKQLQHNPSWYLKEDDEIYKAYIPKFPYKILFTFDDQKIVIWAIAHLHRKPSYWQSRVG